MKRALALLVLIILAAYSLVAQQQRELTIESIFSDTGVIGRGPETVKWSPDGQKVSFVQRDDTGEHGALYYIDVATGKRAVLVAEEKLAALAPPVSTIKDERERERVTRYSIAAYQWAPDSKHLLFDSRGQLWYYSLDTGTAVQLTSSPDPSGVPKFSPNGKYVAYVRKHNLYVRAIDSKNEHELTRDTDENLLNGEVDWLYAEELDVRTNYHWSPDSKHILFLQMNEKPVPTYPITDWIPQHPKVDQEKYPKAGDANPEVRLGVINIDGGGARWLLSKPMEGDYYIPRFGWIREGLAWAQVLNRAQTGLDLYFIDTADGKSQRVLSEKEPDAWVNVSDAFQVLPSGDRFLWASWRDGHTHVYLYSFDKKNPLAGGAKLDRQLTKGDFEVFGTGRHEAGGYSVSGNSVFVMASPEDPRQRQLFSVPLNGGPMQSITRERGTHSPNFSPNAQYYVDTYSSLMTPSVMALCKVGGACNELWRSKGVDPAQLIAPKPLELKAADGATILYGTLLLPPNVAPEAKVPVILNPYGGPGAQTVRDAWGGSGFLYDQILARRGFAILKVDNRGMAGRSKAFQAASRRKFGEVELADQLAALDQVLQANPQLDPTRVGWWGWSYGGYMTLYAMTHTDRIKAGVAGAPVTDWRDYDSTYTERYMGMPRENEAGYTNSSPVTAAKNLRGRVLEVHGTSDDNVHMQNTIQMINNLINSGIQFDLQLYPRKTHGITGRIPRTHLYTRILQHFETYLMNAK